MADVIRLVFLQDHPSCSVEPRLRWPKGQSKESSPGEDDDDVDQGGGSGGGPVMDTFCMQNQQGLLNS